MKINAAYNRIETLLAGVGSYLQSMVLLAMRLYWGWQFFLTGKGKLMHLDRVAEFFASLSIPWPKLSAGLTGTIECVGGLLLLIGLGTRVVSVPLLVILTMAYLTADIDAVHAIFSDPGKFTSAAPFLFMLAVVVVFVFGPGKLSLDAWLKRPGSAKSA